MLRTALTFGVKASGLDPLQVPWVAPPPLPPYGSPKISDRAMSEISENALFDYALYSQGIGDLTRCKTTPWGPTRHRRQAHGDGTVEFQDSMKCYENAWKSIDFRSLSKVARKGEIPMALIEGN